MITMRWLRTFLLLSGHARVQSVPHHSPVLVSKIRLIDIPAHRSPADKLSFGTITDVLQSYTPVIPSSPDPLVVDSKPVPTPPLNVTGVDTTQGNIDISAAPSMAHLDPHPIPGGEEVSQQRVPVIISSIVYDAPSMFHLPYTDPGS
jgi:hypothetical protein